MAKPRPRKSCTKCGRLITNSNFEKHFKVCDGKAKNSNRVKEKWKQPNGKYKCPDCNKEFSKKGIGSHVWRMHTKEGQKFNPKKGDKQAWNKGLTKETDERVKRYATACHEGYKSGRNKPSFKGKKHPQETKDRISKSRIEYLKKHPDKIPYRLNHSSKMSYPEKRFMESLEENNIVGWVYKYQVGLYEYDFAFPEIKLDVEIDGGTHLQEKVKKIDQRRDAWSRSRGWEVLRFTAKEVKSNIQQLIEQLKIVLKRADEPGLAEGT